MKLKGKLQKDITNFIDCNFIIEQQLLHNVRTEGSPIINFTSIPKDKNIFQFRKILSNSFVPAEHNYQIEYINESNQKIFIYLKLSCYKVFRIKWHLRKYEIQDKSLRLNVYKFFICALFTTLGYFSKELYLKIIEKPILNKTTKEKKYNKQKNIEKDSLLKDNNIIENQHKDTTIRK